MKIKQNLRFTRREMAIVGMFSALTAILSQIAVPVEPVPFSLGIFGVMLCAQVLETKLAVAAQLVYVLLGAAGAPVFAGFQGGAARVVGPTGGFLIGYIIMAFVISFILSRAKEPGWLAALLANGAGIIVCYTFGALWLMISLNLGIKKVLPAYVLPFLPMDVVKAVLAAAIGLRMRSALQKAGLLPAR